MLSFWHFGQLPVIMLFSLEPLLNIFVLIFFLEWQSEFDFAIEICESYIRDYFNKDSLF
jgi:hypothetical protein